MEIRIDSDYDADHWMQRLALPEVEAVAACYLRATPREHAETAFLAQQGAIRQVCDARLGPGRYHMIWIAETADARLPSDYDPSFRQGLTLAIELIRRGLATHFAVSSLEVVSDRMAYPWLRLFINTPYDRNIIVAARLTPRQWLGQLEGAFDVGLQDKSEVREQSVTHERKVVKTMVTECFSDQELNEIEHKLAGADEAREIQVCDEHELSRGDAYELMDGRGYDWDDRWVKRQPTRQ